MTDIPRAAEKVWQALWRLHNEIGRPKWPVQQTILICDRPFEFYYKIESGLIWRSVETAAWKIHCLESARRTSRSFGGWRLVRGSEADLEKDVVFIVLAISAT